MAATATRAFGARLRELRCQAGMNGSQLAVKLGWPSGAAKVSKLEHGQLAPSESELSEWLAACGASPALPQLIETMSALGISYRASPVSRRRNTRPKNHAGRPGLQDSHQVPARSAPEAEPEIPGGRGPKRYLTMREIAADLNISKMTVNRLIWSGDLRAIRIGRCLRISRADYAAYLEGCVVDPGTLTDGDLDDPDDDSGMVLPRRDATTL